MDAVNRTWTDLKRSILRDREELSNALDAESRELDALSASTTTTLAALTAQVSNLAGLLAGGTFATLSDLTTLESDLLAHVVDPITHGTTSNLVGESDEQPLDSKVIGEYEPRYGRFRALMSASTVDVTEHVVIPISYNMVVGGPFSVYGTLDVVGVLVVL
jgi:hypothetical protein